LRRAYFDSFLAVLFVGRNVYNTVVLVLHSLATGDEQVYRKKLPDGDNHIVGPARWLKDSQSLLILVFRGEVTTGTWYQVDLKNRDFKETVNRGPNRAAIASLSPDNKTFYVDPANTRTTNAWDRIVAIDLATQQQREVVILPGTPDTLPRPGQIAIALSPDSRTLAIATVNPKTNETRKGLVDVNGGKYRELYGPYRASNTNDKLAWTKDGRAILFATNEGNVNGDWKIMRIGVEGGKPESTGLTVKALSNFDLSPDGSRIVLGTLATGSNSVEVVAMDNLPALLKNGH
jgi:Tol biopolymer transport system component